MEILDEDIQMVRSWLEEAKAPEYIKGHFENLVEMQAADAELVEDLEHELKKLRGASVERDELKEQVDELESELEQRNSDQDSALETVKYWLHDFFYGKCVTKTPRQILRIVEEAL